MTTALGDVSSTTAGCPAHEAGLRRARFHLGLNRPALTTAKVTDLRLRSEKALSCPPHVEREGGWGATCLRSEHLPRSLMLMNDKQVSCWGVSAARGQWLRTGVAGQALASCPPREPPDLGQPARSVLSIVPASPRHIDL
ncbi:hypothetical protein SRHO_G00000970 [Serrasalmus rhombeus]